MAKRISSLAYGYVEQHTNIFNPCPLLSFFSPPPHPFSSLSFLSLTTLPLMFACSHRPLLISLPLCSYYCIFSVSLCFSFSPCLFLSTPNTLLLPKAQLLPACWIAVTTLTISLDNLLACTYFCESFPSLSFYHWTRERPVKVNSWTYTQRVIHP